MEKLIDLLNEYDDGLVSRYDEYDENLGAFFTNVGQMMPETEIISKDYGFIKWLVENKKIDRDKCGFKNEGLSGNWYDSGIAFVQNYDNDTFKVSEFYSPYLQLLMLLAIQDEPIEFLISLLK